jgi:hypothetical protein
MIYGRFKVQSISVIYQLHFTPPIRLGGLSLNMELVASKEIKDILK